MIRVNKESGLTTCMYTGSFDTCFTSTTPYYLAIIQARTYMYLNLMSNKTL